jgi:predicted ABC-type ATPase
MLVLVNGPPGIGKSTIARRWVLDRPLALNVDIDNMRVLMGQWADHPESKRLARQLALAMIATHLDSGHDVVVPQMVSNPAFVARLRACAEETGAVFRHVALIDTPDGAVARMQVRRSALRAGVAEHPLRDTDPERDREAVEYTQRAVQDMGAICVPTREGDIDATYASLVAAVGSAS